MEAPEQLIERARRGYERGRFAMALRPAAPTVLVAAGLAWWSGQVDACLCLGALVAGAVTALRFAGRGGTEAARDGLRLGSVVALAVVGAVWALPACGRDAMAQWCGIGCGVLGLAAGLWVSQRQRSRQLPVGTALGAVVVAASAAAIGCVGFGAGGLLGLIAGLAAGCAATVAWLGRPNGAV